MNALIWALMGLGAAYSVPVPVELAPEGTFALPSAVWSAVPEGRELAYVLPDDLTGGKPVEIKLAGRTPVLGEGLVPFFGELASGGCTLLSESRVLCMVQYKLATFGTDPEEFSRAAREYLRSKYSGSAELSSRLAVQAVFKNEPAGIVSLEIR